MATQETKAEGIEAGVPLADFEATVNTLQALQREGKYQIFLARPNAVRFIGDTDQFRVSFAKRLGGVTVEAKRADGLLEEVQMVLRLVLASEGVTRAARILEEGVFSDEFKSAGEDPGVQGQLRNEYPQKGASGMGQADVRGDP